MEIIDKVATKLNIVPKLRLGVRIVKPDGKSGGVKSTGAHKVTLTEEPMLVMGKSFEGKQRQELKFIVEKDGQKMRWMVPILNKENQPNYLMERIVELKLKIGDVLILEMKKAGANNYTEIRRENDESVIPDEVHADEEYEEDPEAELAKELEKEAKREQPPF